MVVAPAAGIGLLAVFGIGFLITGALLYLLVQDVGNRSYKGWWTERKINIVSAVGGAAAVVFVFHLMLTKDDWGNTIWIILTVVGIVIGLLSFALNDSSKNRGKNTKSEFRAKAKPPPSQEYQYKSSQKQQSYRPKSQARQSNPSPKPPPKASSSEDPYRELMAKAQYNQKLVDHLIDKEREHTPFANFDDICRRILARWDG